MTQFEQYEPSIQNNMIVLWHDEVSNIPAGWVVCDGNNGTPDLRDRFMKATKKRSSVPGATGGENSKILSEGQMPSHTHGASVDTTGSHQHGIGVEESAETNGNASVGGDGGDDGDTTANGSHSHSYTLDSVGSGNSIENRPPYIESYYIMRL